MPGTWKVLSILHILHSLIFTWPCVILHIINLILWWEKWSWRTVKLEFKHRSFVLVLEDTSKAGSCSKEVLRVTPQLLPRPGNKRRLIYYSGFFFLHLIKSSFSWCWYLASLPQSLNLTVFMDRSTSRIIFICQAPIELVSPDH